MTSPQAAPRLRACDEAHAAEVTGGWVTQVEPPVDAYRPPRPSVFGRVERWALLESRLPTTLPATRVAGLPGALVVGVQGWVVTPDRHVVVPLSWYESGGRASLSSIRWEREEHLPGTVLNLTTINGATNYGHFLLDGLGRLAVADGLGIGPDTVDWVLAPAFGSTGADLMLERLGIPAERTVRGRDGVAITADVVLTPSLPGTARVYRPVLPRFLRRFVPPSDAGRRLFVSRREGRRALINADEVEALAVKHGYEVIDPMSCDMPVVLAGASSVVGAHGAALADLAFCPPGTTVLELMPSDHMFPYYFTLSTAGDLRYSVVVGASTEERDPDAWGGSPYAFEVGLDDLDIALREID